MGDFSLTAIDTLSSLALMADSSDLDAERFWETVGEVVRIYWFVDWLACGTKLIGSKGTINRKSAMWLRRIVVRRQVLGGDFIIGVGSLEGLTLMLRFR